MIELIKIPLEERKETYVRMLKDYENGWSGKSSLGMCHWLWFRTKCEHNVEVYPELWAQEPKIMPPSGYWFPRRYRKVRIEVIKKAIRLCVYQEMLAAYEEGWVNKSVFDSCSYCEYLKSERLGDIQDYPELYGKNPYISGYGDFWFHVNNSINRIAVLKEILLEEGIKV